ncbi:hypothetical protein H0H92_009497 [Tricholoma furcatifolium]|nr:hypothetical protein H0H92_009497 [Tricholoma furcatifolium]
MATTLESYQVDLIEKAMSVDALKFGSFTLKSGRSVHFSLTTLLISLVNSSISPYFFNAGLLSTGPILASLSSAYAATIAGALSSSSNPLPKFDVLFGPAYKGIPFAATTALVLHTKHNIDVGFAYDRKEAKDHGEGGVMVGVPVAGKRVVILDDVMTSGKAVRQAIETVRKAGGEVVGVVQALDREEVGQDGFSSTVNEVEGLVGVGRVKAILRMRDLLAWLEKNGMEKELENMREYWQQYGIKSNPN